MRESDMAVLRNLKSNWVGAGVLAVAVTSAGVGQARAGSNDAIAAGVGGLIIGTIIGGAMSQGNQQNRGSSDEGNSRRRERTNTNSSGEQRTRSINRSQSSSEKSQENTKAELEKIQESLNLLGYDAGTVDGSMGPKTEAAIQKYQGDKGFKKTGYMSLPEQKILQDEVQVKLATLKGNGTITRSTTPIDPLVTQLNPSASPGMTSSTPTPPSSTSVPANSGTETAATNAPIAKPDTRIELAHWDTVRNTRNPRELEDYVLRFPNGEFTTLASVRLESLRTELANEADARRVKTKLALADSMPSATAAPGQLMPIDDSIYPRARTPRRDAVAVIIGNSAYAKDVPSVDYAIRDAEEMKAMTIKSLGLDPSNVIFLKDATRVAMDEVFGTDKNHMGKLWRLIDPDGHSDVFVFYSGHGVPDISNSVGNLLLPVDSDPKLANLNGYPVNQLYANLEKLKTKSTTVFLDACFSGQAANDTATRLITDASPVFITKATPSDSTKLNVFAATGEKQLSSWDKESQHGIFTKYVLAGLAGEADADKNKEITAQELQDYVSKQVRKAARRVHGREQDPQFTGMGGFVISSY
jgi:peptidoglycan hydrolase-like protein with peptidoglycan-binding domain